MNPQPHEPAQPDLLRDARLAQALRHMPDAQLLPDAALRNSVLQAAERALLESPRQPAAPAKVAPTPDDANPWRAWWTWLVGRPGERVPLVGALASVLLASLITVMWSGEELPDAEPKGAPVATTGSPGHQASSADTQHTVVTAEADVRPAPKAAPPQPQSAAKTAGAPSPQVVAQALPADAPNNPPLSAPVTMAQPAPLAAPAPLARTEPVAHQDVEVWLDGRQHALAAEQASALLAMLRALPLASTPANDAAAQFARAAPAAKSARAGVDSARSAADAVELQATEAAFSVQTPQDERWDISATEVRVVRGGRVSTSPLTNAQWRQLRALAAHAGVP